jgi:hypothetical protein
MKDIIRQAVADAAQYLHLAHGIAGAVMNGFNSSSLVQAAKELREDDADRLRRGQLAEFEKGEIFDTMTISCPAWGEDLILVSHEGGSRPVTPEELRSIRGAVKIDDVVIRGPGGFVGHGARETVASVTRRREECADAAQWMLGEFPEWATQSLLFDSPRAIIKEASMRGYKPKVTLPRGLLEEAILCLEQTGQNVSLSADLKKYL